MMSEHFKNLEIEKTTEKRIAKIYEQSIDVMHNLGVELEQCRKRITDIEDEIQVYEEIMSGEIKFNNIKPIKENNNGTRTT